MSWIILSWPSIGREDIPILAIILYATQHLNNSLVEILEWKANYAKLISVRVCAIILWFFLCRDIVMDLCLISYHYRMQKSYLYILISGTCCRSKQTPFNFSRFQFVHHPIFIILNYYSYVFWPTLNNCEHYSFLCHYC